ncbi:MAG: YicC family protein [Clostridia bacterium]|nr:YicC family protein [Clostridia bacterium]
MMRSMTAFGRAEAALGERTVTVEIRSVNSRFLDCNARMPRGLASLEPRIKPYLQSRGILRGKVDVTVSLSAAASLGTALMLDSAAAAEYIAALRALRDEFSLVDDISVMQVAQREELFVRRAEELDAEEMWQAVEAALSPAVDAFLACRDAEGERLLADMRDKLQSVREALARIEKTSAADVTLYRERLTARVRDVLADLGETPDESRLLTECAIHADRIAIDEELVRLSSHLASFEEMAGRAQPSGRQLDFLLQEMNREANTIGSKCLDAVVALEVVDIKCTLEKIREQIQNIE